MLMVQGRKPDPKRRRRLAALRAQGLSYAAIGRMIGISRQSVQETLRRMEQPHVCSVPCSACGEDIISAGALPRDQATALCLACLKARPHAPFGQRVKALRLAAGLTQAELAGRTGINPCSLRKYESGEAAPRQATLVKLAHALHVKPRTLEGMDAVVNARQIPKGK
jgi:transcriptional regulator with XRE-family HTH domain